MVWISEKELKELQDKNDRLFKKLVSFVDKEKREEFYKVLGDYVDSEIELEEEYE